MPWHSLFPVGNISVKSNRVIGNDNTTYTEVTMGNSIVGTNTVTTRDHFWNVGGDEDGRHRFIQSPAFTVGGLPEDPVIGTGMNGVFYLKLANDIPQWFAKTREGVVTAGTVYQATPNVKTGSIAIPSTGTYTNIVAMPINCYGEIFLYTTAQGSQSAQRGYFRTSATLTEAWSYTFRSEGESQPQAAIIFANGSDALGLDIRGRRGANAASATWNYIITYRAL